VLHMSAFWAHKTVVVGGATGFLGGWLVRVLLEQGAKVVSIVRTFKHRSQLSLENLSERTTVERGSVCFSTFVSHVFERHPVDVFFHAAYGADVNRVLEKPIECFRSSVAAPVANGGM